LSGYERFALVLDSASETLGRAAVELLELGIDVLYANDVSEAALLAHQESERLGAVLLAASCGRDGVDRVLSQVCAKIPAGPSVLVVAGADITPEFVEHLRDCRVGWLLAEPYAMRELRFVVAAAMSTGYGGERRKHLRIPTDMATAVFMGRHRKDVTVHDLSVSGAYFATQFPFLEGSQLSVEIPLPGGAVMGKAVVVNAKTADKPGRPDVPDGMGVSFTELAPEAEAALREHVDAWIARFRVGARTPDDGER